MVYYIQLNTNLQQNTKQAETLTDVFCFKRSGLFAAWVWLSAFNIILIQWETKVLEL